MQNYDRLKKFEYAITGDIDAPDHGYHYSDEIADLLHKTYLKVQKRKPHLIPELLKLIEKYPKVPAFKNYLTSYYQLSGKKEKAFEANRWLVKEHPDYLHGKINLAVEYIEKGQFEEVPKVLGEALDLKDLYPHREVFHISEFQSFFMVSCEYLIQTGQLEAAESHIEMAEDILEDKSVTGRLRTMILQKRLAMRYSEQKEWDDLHDEGPTDKGYDRSIQTEEEPVFLHPEMEALYENGLRIPQDLLREILALPRESLLQDLETVLWDSVRRYEYFSNLMEDELYDEGKLDFPLHAWFLLTELNATDKLPLLLNAFRQGEELLEFWYNDHRFETLWRFIYRLGHQQLDVLKAFMLEPDIVHEGKTIISQAVSQIALHHPERRDEILQWYEEILRYFLEHQDDIEGLIDVELIAPMLADLVPLHPKEMLPLIKTFYDANLVNIFYIGDYKDLEKDILGPPKPHHKHKVFDNIFEHLNHILTTWAGYLSAEENKKRTEEMRAKLEAEHPELALPKRPLPAPPVEVPVAKREGPKVGRNDPCPCGSGKKYKKCCM